MEKLARALVMNFNFMTHVSGLYGIAKKNLEETITEILVAG